MWQTRITIIAAMLAGLLLLPLPSMAQATFTPNAKACSLLPIADLEAHFGGKATPPRGVTGVSAGSTCSVHIKSQHFEHVIKIQSEPPGTPGLPRTIKEGLAGARMLLEDAKAHNSAVVLLEEKDFGSIGCYSAKVSLGQFASKSGAWGYGTTCFLVQGGYLQIDVSSDNPKDISLEVVKGFLEKAASRR
jgi:hypothetical protein